MDRFQHILGHLIPCINRDPTRIYRGNLREVVLKKFNNRCAICYRHQIELEKPLQIHHIFPWSAGGYTVLENSIPLCHDICHPLADLSAWSPEYLIELNQQAVYRRLERLLDLSNYQPIEEAIHEADADNLSSGLSWEERLSKIIDSWTILSRGHKSVPRSDFIEISARLLWSISKIITTYVPDQRSIISWRHIFLPKNSVVGINLAEKARSLIKRYANPTDPASADLVLGMTHTVSTHYRSFGHYARAFRQDKEHMNILLSEEACEAVKNPSSRAYYLTAYCIDLAELKKAEARLLINKGLRWAQESGDIHSIADTIVRVSEIELRLDRPEECLRYLEKKNDFGSAWGIIMNDIPIVQAIAHKICMRAHARLGNWSDVIFHYKEAINIARRERLEDQTRKILEIYNRLLSK